METAVTPGLVHSFELAILVQSAIAVGLHLWARPFRSRMRWLPWLPFAGLALILAGLGATIAKLQTAFVQVAALAPADKAMALSESIGDAMSTTLFLALPGFAIYLVTAVLCIVHTFQAARRA